MATKKVTITIPEELLEAARGLTDNISGFAAEAFAEQIRRELLAEEMRRYQAEYGEFTEAELAEARHRLFGTPDESTGRAG
ncbi:type II toxin-antitoxin system CcdA family antitoxin [Myceligenerans crystallogenes]